ncbi:MAG: hypothetical protein ACI3XY_09040 [Butyricicoccaceae bacterium]
MVTGFYEVFWVFLIYSFLGWCMEVTYAAVCNGTFVNRGFLNGPVCPIYGVGVLLVIGLLWPLKENALILFVGSVIVTTVLEFLVGWVLEKLFHDKWWDYSDLPFNIKGYVCLKFSLLWGIACMLIVRVIHPSIMALIRWVPHLPGVIVGAALGTVFIGDLIITVIAVRKLSIRLHALEELDRALDNLSETIGEELSERVLTLQEKADILGEQLESSKAKAEDLRDELRARSQKLLEQSSYIHERIMKAYPQLGHQNHAAIMERLEHLREERKKNRKKKK